MDETSAPTMDESLRCLPQSRKVEESIEKAINLIQSYTETDWRQQTPEQTLESLNAARNEITERWEILQKEMTATESVEMIEDRAASEQEIRIAFVDMITEAFGDMLHNMQTENVDIEALVDCLQSGLDMINAKNLVDLAWCEDDDDDDDIEEEGTSLTPHEYRRRAVGFAVEEASA